VATEEKPGTAPKIRSHPSRNSNHSPRVLFRFAKWYSGLYRFINTIYFKRISLLNSDRLPGSGPVLFLGLHRNGAVDGFVYHYLLHGPVFMISTQLRKNILSKLFFNGIEVSRTKDKGNRSFNDATLHRCFDLLQRGGALFIFPEGTSSLGPQHLPFKNGAAWLLLNYLESGGPSLQVVPLGIHYSCPEAFQSKVEVVVGHSISTALPDEASRLERLRILKRRVHAAMEEVGINVSSEEYQALIRRFASVATMSTKRSYFKSLKAMERAIPEPILQKWSALARDLAGTKLWSHQGLPLFPMNSILLSALALIVTGVLVFSAVVVNLPAFIAGWLAGKKLPDDRNVISLWKILVGVPCFALWIAILLVTLISLGKFPWLAAYAAVTWLGLKCYSSFKKTCVAVHNTLRHPALRPRVIEFFDTVLQSIPDETPAPRQE
jgi:1-acyl-sn-glycerol-3-phosphate acyltransferase